jgi:hypothetical protein
MIRESNRIFKTFVSRLLENRYEALEYSRRLLGLHETPSVRNAVQTQTICCWVLHLNKVKSDVPRARAQAVF